MNLNNILFVVILLLMSSCATENPLIHANQIAQQGHLTQKFLVAGQFTLNTYSRITSPNQPIHIYIEGDGFAWVSKYQLSSDPTPKQALALQLASLDPTENVVYIARPCQFVDFETTTCNSAYWSDKRFSQEVIDSMNKAVDYFSNLSNTRLSNTELSNTKLSNTKLLEISSANIHLIGYSGGAAVAVLLTAKRCLKSCDIASIRTVAGNLNTELLNQTHHVSSMPGSLNPINVAKQLQYMPQIHFVGADDERVPASISTSFTAQQTGNCAAIVQIKQADHEHGWVENWVNLLKNTPKC